MSDDNPDTQDAVYTTKENDKTPEGRTKRWLTEWDMSSTAEKGWREDATNTWKIYESKKASENSFNILWSNTETLRPAIYNSQPSPDVRRRFRDPDPIGKVAATVIQRAITYSLDAYDFDTEIINVVLDTLLAGRGVARVKYVPTFKAPDKAEGDVSEDDSWMGDEKDPSEEDEECTPDMYVAGESTVVEHVDWDKFRHGPGNKFSDVPWIGFEHQMRTDELVKSFGSEKAKLVKLEEVTGLTNDKDNEEIQTLMRVGTVFEIWDKENRKVLFLSPGVKTPLKEEDDPLELDGFFPVPRPVYAIENSQSLVPGILYKKYEPQAVELNRVTMRINKIVDALKVRGAYSAHLTEVPQIVESADNVLVPIQNASEVAAMGGLDKAIWLMPIDQLAKVLTNLYEARKQTIDTIYQVTGLGDILRGVSNPHETAKAQTIKTQWGTMRLQRLQRETQRFIRDLIRLKAEIYTKHFDAKTLESMTGIKLPTDDDKAKLKQQLGDAATKAQMQGQQPQPPPKMVLDILKLPSWDDVMKLMQSEAMRMYRIDVETDSTIAETVDRDLEGLQQAMTAVTAVFSTLAPAIERGYLSVDVVKTLAGTVARTAKMGTAVEDALDAIQQPPPPPPPPPDTSVQVAQVKTQSDQQKTQAQIASAERITQIQEAARLEAVKAQGQNRMAEIQETGQMKLAIANAVEDTKKMIAQFSEQAKTERETTLAQMNAVVQQQKSELDNAVKILVAAITAKTAEAAAEAKAEETFISSEED
jgi:hypothetical protein